MKFFSSSLLGLLALAQSFTHALPSNSNNIHHDASLDKNFLLKRELVTNGTLVQRDYELSYTKTYEYLGFCVTVSKLLITNNNDLRTGVQQAINLMNSRGVNDALVYWGHFKIELWVDYFVSGIDPELKRSAVQWFRDHLEENLGNGGWGITQHASMAIGDAWSNSANMAIWVQMIITDQNTGTVFRRDVEKPKRGLEGRAKLYKRTTPWNQCYTDTSNSWFQYQGGNTCTGGPGSPYGCNGCCCGVNLCKSNNNGQCPSFDCRWTQGP